MLFEQYTYIIDISNTYRHTRYYKTSYNFEYVIKSELLLIWILVTLSYDVAEIN